MTFCVIYDIQSIKVARYKLLIVETTKKGKINGSIL